MAKIDPIPPWLIDDVSWNEVEAPAKTTRPGHDPKTGRWLPGCPSPNPKGRPKGRWADKLHALVPKALAAIEEAIENGDMSAVGHILSRTVPSLKAESPEVEFELDPSATPAEMSSQILRAVSKGQLTLDVAESMQRMIATHCGLRDMETLAEELRRVESRQLNRIRGGVLIDANHS